MIASLVKSIFVGNECYAYLYVQRFCIPILRMWSVISSVKCFLCSWQLCVNATSWSHGLTIFWLKTKGWMAAHRMWTFFVTYTKKSVTSWARPPIQFGVQFGHLHSCHTHCSALLQVHTWKMQASADELMWFLFKDHQQTASFSFSVIKKMAVRALCGILKLLGILLSCEKIDACYCQRMSALSQDATLKL